MEEEKNGWWKWGESDRESREESRQIGNQREKGKMHSYVPLGTTFPTGLLLNFVETYVHTASSFIMSCSCYP